MIPVPFDEEGIDVADGGVAVVQRTEKERQQQGHGKRKAAKKR